MSAISVGIVQVRSALERVVAIEDLGKAMVRWGVVIILAWIGGMKFTAYEAMGIQPLIAHSLRLSWMYDFLSALVSTMLGFLEIGTALLIALRSVSPQRLRLAGCSRLACFATTLFMLFSTLGWEPSLGFSTLSGKPGQSLLRHRVPGSINLVPS